MKLKTMVVTGDEFFLRRHRPLVETLSLYCDRLDYLYGDRPFSFLPLNQAVKVVNKLIYLASPLEAGRRQKNDRTFIAKSQRIEQRIQELGYQPEYVFHFFSMYCPFWGKSDVPYGMYLDYTMALVERNWQPWAPFRNTEEFQAWLACERLAYERADHLFTMSQVVRSSLITDYHIQPEKITVVGSFANRHALYEGEKLFGSQQILFNGAEFERKGGDLVLAAFQRVKQALPQAQLVIIGQKLNVQQDGVHNLGRVGSLEEMRQLLLNSDLVVAPARCDPFPSFVMEAMNYGVPCVVSNHDGMPEIVDHGISGMVVDPLTPEQLADTMIHLLTDPERLTAMSHQARQKIAQQLNRHQVAEKIMQAVSRNRDRQPLINL